MGLRQLRKLKLKPKLPRQKMSRGRSCSRGSIRGDNRRESGRRRKYRRGCRIINNQRIFHQPSSSDITQSHTKYLFFAHTCTISRWHFCSLVVLQSDLPFVTKDLIKDSMKITRYSIKNRTNYFSRHNFIKMDFDKF